MRGTCSEQQEQDKPHHGDQTLVVAAVGDSAETDESEKTGAVMGRKSGMQNSRKSKLKAEGDVFKKGSRKMNG